MSGTECVHMTAAQYAVHRDVSDSYVRRLRRAGRVVECEHALIDVAATDALLRDDLHPLRGGDRQDALEITPEPADPPPPNPAAPLSTDGGAPKPPSVHEAVRRERLARARLAELELGEQAGDLMRRRDVERAVVTLVRQAISRFRLLSPRLRGQLAATTDANECSRLLDAEVDEICADMRRASVELLKQGDAACDVEGRAA